MIELMTGFPASIVGIRAKGRITSADYERVIIPAVEAALKNRDKVRLYYEIGTDFQGIDPKAIFDDLKIGLRELPHWEKLAVVTDVSWIRSAVGAFAFLIHGIVKVFPVSQASEARRWIAED